MWWSKLNTIKFKDNDETENVTAPLKKERCIRIPYNTVISIQTSLDFAKADVRIADVYENVKTSYTPRIFLDKQAIPNSAGAISPQKYHYSLKIKYSSSLPKNDKIRIRITKNGKKYFSKLFYICSEYQNNKIVAIGTGVASDGTILDNKKYRLSFGFAHYCDFEFFQHEIADNSISYSNDNGQQISLQSKVVPLTKCFFGNRYYLPEWQMIALSICLRFDMVFVYFWTDKKLKWTIGGNVVEILRKGKTAGLTAVEINSPEYVAETSLNCTLSGTFKMDYSEKRLIDYSEYIIEHLSDINDEAISMGLSDGDETIDFDAPISWLTSPLPYYYIDRNNFIHPKIFKNRLPRNARLSSSRKLNIPDNFLNENDTRVITWDCPPISKIGNDTFENVTLAHVGRVTSGEVTIGKNFNLALPDEQLILSQGELNGGNPNTPFFFKKDIVIKNREITSALTPSKKIKKVEGCEIGNNVVLDGCEILNCEVKATNNIVTLNNCDIGNSFNKKNARFLGMDNADSHCKNSFNGVNHILPLTSKFKEVENSFIYRNLLSGTIEAQLINSAGMGRNVALSSNYFETYHDGIKITTAKDILKLNDDGGLTLLKIDGELLEIQKEEWNIIRAKISHGNTIYSDGFFNFEAYPNSKKVELVALDNYTYTANAFKHFRELALPYSVFKSQFQTGDCFCNIYAIEIVDDVTDVFQSDVYYIPSNLVEVTHIVTSVRIRDLLSPLYPDINYSIE